MNGGQQAPACALGNGLHVGGNGGWKRKGSQPNETAAQSV
jgi:hypothetical protein